MPRWWTLISKAAKFQRRRKDSGTTTACWAGKVLAESCACAEVEGHQYFPPHAVNRKFLKPSTHTSICPWKGTAHYYHVEVDGMKVENGAWYYPQPNPAAAHIKDHIAFWKGIRIEA
jgi:uncharacterized protein (DUF427 family)